MLDIRNQLMRSATVPQVYRKTTKSLTVHWNGPAFTASDIEQLKGDARFHVQVRGWDGLSYHYGIGRDGVQYMCRDKAAKLAHSGVVQGNNESYAVLVLTGEGMVPMPVQLTSLESLISDLKINPRHVLGHRFWPRLTACPGAQLSRWLYSYWKRNSGQVIEATTTVVANVRDEASVLSHVVRKLSVGTKVTGKVVLHDPFKGDALWIQLNGTNDYVHASTCNL